MPFGRVPDKVVPIELNTLGVDQSDGPSVWVRPAFEEVAVCYDTLSRKDSIDVHVVILN